MVEMSIQSFLGQFFSRTTGRKPCNFSKNIAKFEPLWVKNLRRITKFFIDFQEKCWISKGIESQRPFPTYISPNILETHYQHQYFIDLYHKLYKKKLVKKSLKCPIVKKHFAKSYWLFFLGNYGPKFVNFDQKIQSQFIIKITKKIALWVKNPKFSLFLNLAL